MLDSSVPRCRAIVDLGAIQSNYATLRSRAGRGAVLACVVKADAYGHGARPVVAALCEAGARHFAVATLAEAVELREAGVSGLVLVLGGLQRGEEREASAHGLLPLVGTVGQLQRWNDEGHRLGRTLPCHICLNTGMNRLGIDFDPSQEPSGQGLLRTLAACGSVDPVGFATHHAAAEDLESDQAEHQERLFAEQLTALRRAGHVPRIVHSANSAALLYRGLSATGGDRPALMARPGLALYGYVKPPLGAGATCPCPVRPALEWRARLMAIRSVAKGALVGYGATFMAPRDMRLGVLSVGYGDGLDWRLSNRGAVAIRGNLCRIVGQVSMDLTMSDLTEAPDASEGDEAVLLGPSPYDAMGMADLTGGIPYQVLCGISRRVPRQYVRSTSDR